MSAPDRHLAAATAPGLRIEAGALAIVEIAERRGQGARVAEAMRALGLALPAAGHSARRPGTVVLAIRPQRWLVLAAGVGASSADSWTARVGGHASIVDLSAGLAAFCLGGPAWREVLARGCRLDLDPRVFPASRAAATLIAQVGVTLLALEEGALLLTPASTARHFAEWLLATAAPFGVKPMSPLNFSSICGDPRS